MLLANNHGSNMIDLCRMLRCHCQCIGDVSSGIGTTSPMHFYTRQPSIRHSMILHPAAQSRLHLSTQFLPVTKLPGIAIQFQRGQGRIFSSD
ncbi:hypothetical protein OUZ56_008970 [Daphnia magna]|uniref:Uncharacterized protein n=1 Tax=Daphnia magna TaxID=35525 RepID=A0ABR0AEM2_9CRUS|nr:hypothetical protein OUZ56_008970 [Daphnia magna]